MVVSSTTVTARVLRCSAAHTEDLLTPSKSNRAAVYAEERSMQLSVLKNATQKQPRGRYYFYLFVLYESFPRLSVL